MTKQRSTGAKAITIILSALLVFGFLAWMYDSASRYQAARPAIIEAEGRRTIDESIARQLDAGTAALRADTAIASALPVIQWVIIGGLLLGYTVLGVCAVLIWRELRPHRKERG